MVSEYIDYFRQLAVAHKDLRHKVASESGDSKPGEKRFTKVSVEEVVTGLRSKVGFPALMLELYEITTNSEIAYDIKQRPRGALMVLDHKQSETFAAEVLCYVTAERILYDLLKKMWQDHYGVGKVRCNTPFRFINFDGLQITPVGPLFDKEYGYRVEFDFELQDSVDLAEAPEEGTFLDA